MKAHRHCVSLNARLDSNKEEVWGEGVRGYVRVRGVHVLPGDASGPHLRSEIDWKLI